MVVPYCRPVDEGFVGFVLLHGSLVRHIENFKTPQFPRAIIGQEGAVKISRRLKQLKIIQMCFTKFITQRTSVIFFLGFLR